MEGTANHRILALTAEAGLMARIEAHLRRRAAIEVAASTDSLYLIDAYLGRHTRLVILDADLLREHTLRVAHIIRQIEPACRLLLLFSPADLPRCTALLPLGRVSYLVKPFCARRAADLIDAVLQPPRDAAARV